MVLVVVVTAGFVAHVHIRISMPHTDNLTYLFWCHLDVVLGTSGVEMPTTEGAPARMVNINQLSPFECCNIYCIVPN